MDVDFRLLGLTLTEKGFLAILLSVLAFATGLCPGHGPVRSRLLCKVDQERKV